MGYIEDLVKSTLLLKYGNEDVSDMAGWGREYGGEDAAKSNTIKGQDLNSILSLLNETNSGGEKDPSGTDEYKAAYRAVVSAAGIMNDLKDYVRLDSYDKGYADALIYGLRGNLASIEDYLHAKSKGIFFKHPITPKGKKRYACMQNALRIIDAAILHYDRIDTRHDDEAIDVEAATANQHKAIGFIITDQKDKIRKGLDHSEVVSDIITVAKYMDETLFNLDNLTAFLSMYKSNALEVPVKAILMRENTPDANKAVAEAFKLGGPDLSNQLKLAYKLLRQVDTMADELWKGVAVRDKVENATPPNKELLMQSKKEILKSIRQLNIYREINAKGLNRYENGRFI